MSKLRFQVAFASGQDLEYPAQELNHHSPHTRGWQSAYVLRYGLYGGRNKPWLGLFEFLGRRFCEFPQELGLQLAQPGRLTQVQLLSHQCKIATKIELFVGDGQSYAEATWRRLGYLSLDDNSRSDYQARELKSVYIDAVGSYLKLLVHKCYMNKHNVRPFCFLILWFGSFFAISFCWRVLQFYLLCDFSDFQSGRSCSYKSAWWKYSRCCPAWAYCRWLEHLGRRAAATADR